MKAFLVSFFIAFLVFQISFSLLAQVPESFSYQAVVRNNAGQPLVDQYVTLRISILKGGEFGTYVYVETHEGTTNKFGLINTNIGGGNAISGNFESINWSDGPYFLKIELDAAGGTNYSEMGTSPLLSVPYALVAKRVENGDTVNNAYLDKLLSRIEELDARIDKLEAIINPPDTMLMDLDSNFYKIITIGNQEWMAEDLRTTIYSDGTPIANVTSASEWISLSSPAYCWYMNDESHKIPNGALYNWYAVNTQKICPAGWHVPSDSEWKTLEMALGMSQGEADNDGWRGTNEGTKLKNTTGWISGSGTNESGFAAIAGGLRDWDDAAFYWLGYYSHWWTSTEGSSYTAWDRDVSYSNTAIFRFPNNKTYGMSVRCLKN